MQQTWFGRIIVHCVAMALRRGTCRRNGASSSRQRNHAERRTEALRSWVGSGPADRLGEARARALIDSIRGRTNRNAWPFSPSRRAARNTYAAACRGARCVRLVNHGGHTRFAAPRASRFRSRNSCSGHSHERQAARRLAGEWRRRPPKEERFSYQPSGSPQHKRQAWR